MQIFLKFVNNVRKMLQLMADEVSQIPYRGIGALPLDPSEGLSSLRPPKIPGAAIG